MPVQLGRIAGQEHNASRGASEDAKGTATHDLGVCACVYVCVGFPYSFVSSSVG